MVPRALAEQRKEEEKARIMFRALYRLMFVEKGGRPKYPEFTWRGINKSLMTSEQ
jgi:hypothetical protein